MSAALNVALRAAPPVPAVSSATTTSAGIRIATGTRRLFFTQILPRCEFTTRPQWAGTPDPTPCDPRGQRVRRPICASVGPQADGSAAFASAAAIASAQTTVADRSRWRIQAGVWTSGTCSRGSSCRSCQRRSSAARPAARAVHVQSSYERPLERGGRPLGGEREAPLAELRRRAVRIGADHAWEAPARSRSTRSGRTGRRSAVSQRPAWSPAAPRSVRSS